MSNEGEAMSLPAYEIFKKEQTDFTWVGAAQELESAKKRIKELSGHSDAEFVVFDQRRWSQISHHH
jgi:hypothetical protein